MGTFYDYSVITLAVVYCILFVYSNLKLLLSWCIVGLQKGIVSILAAAYILLLFFDLLMIIMIASYHNDLDQQQYVDHSKLPLFVRIIGEYIILYLNFIMNGIILLCFLLFFSGLFGLNFNRKHTIYAVLIIDTIYFLITLISSMLIEFAGINIISIVILSYIYIITLLINTICSIFCLYKLPIALPIDLSIGLYEKNTLCSCYTTVTRYTWYILLIIAPQIIFLCLNILEINIWDFHINIDNDVLNILPSKYARILFFSSQFVMLICIWNVLRISIKQNVELNIVLSVVNKLETDENAKKERLLSISDELAMQNESIPQQNALNIPPEQNTLTNKKGVLVDQDSEQSDRELESVTDNEQQDDERILLPIVENETIKNEEIEVEMININNVNTANTDIEFSDNETHRFEVIVNGVMLYADKHLETEIFSIQIANKDVVDGFYVDETCKIIYLTQYKVYVSGMELNELPDNDININMNTKDDIILMNEVEKESIRFKIVVDGACVYADAELREEIFNVQIHDGEYVYGHYIDDSYKIVYLPTLKVYISSMDVREIGDEEDEEHQAEEKQYKIDKQQSDYSTDALSPIKSDQQSNYSEATTINTMITTSDNYNKDQSVMAESESLDIHNYSMTMKINIHPKLPFIPSVDDINEETVNDNDEHKHEQPEQVDEDEDELELNEISEAVTPIINMNESQNAAALMMDNLIVEDHNIDEDEGVELEGDEGNIDEQKEESSLSSSSFVANVKQQSDNIYNEDENESDDESDESDETVNTEINYSYSSTEATETMTAPNIILKF